MYRSIALAILLCGDLLGLSFSNDSVEGLSFSKDDWQVDCDNTRTCRVTGYDHDISADDSGASIMFVIEPGKDSRIYGFVRTIQDYKKPLTLYVNDKNFGQLQADPSFDNDQFILLGTQIDRLLNSKTISSVELKDQNNILKISANGMTAVFLKIDEFQNRLNTPLALVKKGKQSVDQLKSYVDPPIIKMGKVIKDQSVIDLVTKNIAKFYPYLEKQFDDKGFGGNCGLSYNASIEDIKRIIQIHSLNDHQALISHQCWSAAYNFADLYWLVDKNLDHVEQVGEATSFEDGFLGSFMKGRGIGDCLYFESMAWDGEKFQKSGQENTGMCRGAAGGFWDIPNYVTEVIPYSDK